METPRPEKSWRYLVSGSKTWITNSHCGCLRDLGQTLTVGVTVFVLERGAKGLHTPKD